MTDYPPASAPLATLQPERTFFVGIDSDGCVFDTMEIKQKECFIPNIIRHWGLQSISKYVRQTAEFINLYSRWRGINRWPGLVLTFDLLRERPEVRARGAAIPDVPDLRAFVGSGFPHSNDGLSAYMAEYGATSELETAMAWSLTVNAAIEDMVTGVPPFPFVRQTLERLRREADCIVVSGTPDEALRREWKEHDIDGFVRLIAGQEMGKKSLHLTLAAGGKYEKGRMLMIGDGPGDLKAARTVGALFFPVNPGHEERSWQVLFEEGIDRFLAGSFAGVYESALIEEFHALLPETPPWA